jgi:hypothetical protein
VSIVNEAPDHWNWALNMAQFLNYSQPDHSKTRPKSVRKMAIRKPDRPVFGC